MNLEIGPKAKTKRDKRMKPFHARTKRGKNHDQLIQQLSPLHRIDLSCYILIM